jgi:hypothetical protein
MDKAINKIKEKIHKRKELKKEIDKIFKHAEIDETPFLYNKEPLIKLFNLVNKYEAVDFDEDDFIEVFYELINTIYLISGRLASVELFIAELEKRK